MLGEIVFRRTRGENTGKQSESLLSWRRAAAASLSYHYDSYHVGRDSRDTHTQHDVQSRHSNDSGTRHARYTHLT